MMDIDRIARQLIDAEPSADLEARIRARLDQVQAAGHSMSRWLWRVGAPLGATAALALALAVPGPESRVQSPASRVQGLPAVARSAEVGPGVETPIGVRGPESRVQGPSDTSPRRTSQRAQASALSMEESAWMERRIAALEPVDALRMEHLSYTSIQPEALSITPLLMTAMRTDGADIDRQNNR